jgi:hypothetical protein
VLNLPEETIKLGLMDEAWRISPNLAWPYPYPYPDPDPYPCPYPYPYPDPYPYP